MSFHGWWGVTSEMLEEMANPPRPGLANGDIRLISQEFADQIALVAQKYTGYFYGHPTRAGQYNTPEAGTVFVDYSQPWDEPIVFPDDCEFCQNTLADERVIARVDGFQAAIDKEVYGGRGKESFPLNDLPLHLKRRLCVEWNHVFKQYLETHEYLFYDFETREIKAKVKAPEPLAADPVENWYGL